MLTLPIKKKFNIRFYDLITVDMEVDIDGKTFESIFRKILNTFI